MSRPQPGWVSDEARGWSVCWFITVGIDRRAAAELEALGRERGTLRSRASVNPHLAALFPGGDTRFELTHGQCSCGLLGRPEPDDQERRRGRYAQRGWSEAKIARALADRSKARATSPRRRGEDATNELRSLLADLAARSGSVRLFAHSYKGSPDTERVSARGALRVTAVELQLSDAIEDVLVEIVAP